MLFGLTWRLWVGASDFPQVPLLASLTGVPLLADWIAFTLTLISASVLLISSMLFLFQRQPSSSHTFARIAALLFAVSILCLFFLNQHRLQPWAWQFLLYAVLLFLARQSNELIVSARWVTASIYFFSAISKFDYQFLYGLGRQLAETIAETVGVEASGWMSFSAGTMPVFELLIAVLLMVGRTRLTGIVLAAFFHAALIATLGPWGLNHHTGVLVWNVFFFFITTILFFPTSAEKANPVTLPYRQLMFAVTLIMVLYPLLPHCDHWLAWGLYSPNNSRSELEAVYENEQGQTVFQRVDLSKMSLEQLNVPLYPEARFQLGVARSFQQHENLEGRSRIVIKSKSNRFTGQRTSTAFDESDRWNNAQSKFLFNWQPRRL